MFKHTLLKNWTLTRVIGLILGSYFIGDFIATGGVGGLMIGGFVLIQVIFNIGCFAGRCTTPSLDTNQYEDFSDDTVIVEEY